MPYISEELQANSLNMHQTVQQMAVGPVSNHPLLDKTFNQPVGILGNKRNTEKSRRNKVFNQAVLVLELVTLLLVAVVVELATLHLVVVVELVSKLAVVV